MIETETKQKKQRDKETKDEDDRWVDEEIGPAGYRNRRRAAPTGRRPAPTPTGTGAPRTTRRTSPSRAAPPTPTGNLSDTFFIIKTKIEIVISTISLFRLVPVS